VLHQSSPDAHRLTDPAASSDDKSGLIQLRFSWVGRRPFKSSTGRPIFLRRRAARRTLSPRPAGPAFEDRELRQSAGPSLQRFDAKLFSALLKGIIREPHSLAP